MFHASAKCVFQELVQPFETNEYSGVHHEIPPVITPIVKSTTNLKASYLCQSCQHACSKCHLPKVKNLSWPMTINMEHCLDMPMNLAIVSLLSGYG